MKPAAGDEMHVELAVHRQDGSVVRARCNAPIGSWQRPIGAERVTAKALDLLRSTLGQERARATLAAVAQPAERFSVCTLMAPLRGAPAR